MAADFDLEPSGLLHGLDHGACAERAKLIPWLMERGITVEQICSVFWPMLLASRRVIGDDGTYVSTRALSDKTGLDL